MVSAGKSSSPGEEERLAALLSEINKGSGTGFMRLGDRPVEAVDTFGSGSIALDEALGVGGIPRGRIIEIYGPESSGKTSLALHATGNAQRKGLRAAFIDAEHAFDPGLAMDLGVDVPNLYFYQPDSGDDALRKADRLVKSGLFGVITIDSVAALVPEAELKGEIGDTHVGLMARMMSQGLRMLTGPAATTGTTLIFINQLREKVGVFFGNSETQPGGKALKFYSTVRLDVRRIQTIKKGDEAVGSRVRIKVVKNKLSPPFKLAEVDYLFGEGISRTAELVELGAERGVIKKAGNIYRFDGSVKAFNGKDQARQHLRDNPEAADAVEKLVRAAPPASRAPARRGRDEGLTDSDSPPPWDEESSG